jgi:predicted nucleic acid-binding protein
MKIFIDAFAWIEYFKGTSRGLKAKKIIGSEDNELFTIIENLAEVALYYRRNKLDPTSDIGYILTSSKIIQPSVENALNAAKINISERKIKKNFGLIDSLLKSCALSNNAKILTGDKHFENDKKAINI